MFSESPALFREVYFKEYPDSFPRIQRLVPDTTWHTGSQLTSHRKNKNRATKQVEIAVI